MFGDKFSGRKWKVEQGKWNVVGNMVGMVAAGWVIKWGNQGRPDGERDI